MFLKFCPIIAIIAIIIDHVDCTEKRCCSGNCQMNDSTKVGNARGRKVNQSKSTITRPTPSPNCTSVNCLRRKYTQTFPRLTNTTRTAQRPPRKCRRPPPCRKKTCPTMQPANCSTTKPSCPEKVSPPPPSCPQTICPPALQSKKPCSTQSSSPTPATVKQWKDELGRDSDYTTKSLSFKRDKQKDREIVRFNLPNQAYRISSNDCSAEFIKQCKHCDMIDGVTSLPAHQDNHSVVKRSANISINLLSNNSNELSNISNESLSSANATSANFFCNNERLKAIMLANMRENPIVSKELIQKATRAEFMEDFNVICSTDTFAYVTYTDTYCEINDKILTCYAFKNSII